MINLPFTYSYTIINNILTIVFDFSSLSYAEFRNLKRDYFQQGLVLNDSGFDMSFYVGAPRVQTYVKNVSDFRREGDSPIHLRLMGNKIAEHNKATYAVGSSAYFGNEYRIALFSGKDIQDFIDHLEQIKSRHNRDLDRVIDDIENNPNLDKSPNSWLQREKRQLQSLITNNENMIARFRTQYSKVSGQ